MRPYLHDEEDVVIDGVIQHLEQQHHVAVVQVAQHRDLALHLRAQTRGR